MEYDPDSRERRNVRSREGDLTNRSSHAGGIPNFHLYNNDELQGGQKVGLNSRKRVEENLFRIVNIGELSAGLIIKGETIGRGALLFHFVIQATMAQMCEDSI